MTPTNKKTCQVTSDLDPRQEWMTVEATSLLHAAIYYIGACAARSGGPPKPEMDTLLTVRVDGKECRLTAAQAWRWANAIAERDAERRKAAEKKPQRA